MKPGRSWWQVFLACALAVVLAMGWITSRFLGLEQAEREARAESEYQGSLRLALWRVDSWLGPLLAMESARPYTEYLQSQSAGPFEGTPEFILVHFQVDAFGTLTSPELAAGLQSEEAPDQNYGAHLETVRRILLEQEIETCVQESERTQQLLQLRIPKSNPTVSLGSSRRGTDFELSKRQGAAQKLAQTQNQVANRFVPPDQVEEIRLGMFVPLWFGSELETNPHLMFLRRVVLDGESHFQGFLCGWPQLQKEIDHQISDLFPEWQIVPANLREGANFETNPEGTPTVDSTPVGPAPLLATIPASLSTPFFVPTREGGTFDPTRVILAISWVTVLVGLTAVGSAFRSTSELAEKRARFAVAVTHELRTPLTTFRMYTDMLTQGMVTDPKKRDEYIETLHLESERLARLVENVLAFSQLEQGSRQSQVETIAVGALLDRLSGPLIRRAEATDLEMEFDVATCRDTEIRTDVSTVEQILFNLVDNACKYAGTNAGKPIRLRCRSGETSVSFEVVDSGQGVPSTERTKIFAPFERGPNVLDRPGIGLGLALARGLARELGGDLKLLSARNEGACFALTLPR